MEDRISALPDFILHHIISFLPFKDAVRTSALAKQWRYLWTRIPDLDLHQFCLLHNINEEERKNKSFTDIVDQLLCHRGDLRINKFRLRCSSVCAEHHLDLWMQSVSRLGVEELQLWPIRCGEDCKRREDYERVELSPRVFAQCQSLRVIYMGEIKFPAQFNDEPFLFNFPCLVEMSLWSCQLPEILNINCPLLRSLGIEESTVKQLTIMAMELQRLRLNLVDAGDLLRINAPKLVTFECSICYFSQIFLDNVNSVSDASIMLDQSHSRDRNRWLLLELFHSLRNVESLNIYGCVEALLVQENLHQHLPLFWHLKHMETTLVLNEDIKHVLSCLLQKCPNLESIHITPCQKLYYNEVASFQGYRTDLYSSLQRLKTVTFGIMEGEDEEFAFLESLLKSGGVLQHLIVETVYTEENLSRLLERLQTLSLASSNVEISVESL